MATLTLGACVLVLGQLWPRANRTWPISPVWPYQDGANYHWFYKTLSALNAKGSRMAIWGWAAHAWVYSGTIPATRESSTEFAWRDWGKDSYYRKRFMASLTQAPPEYFTVAVGPGHFMFQDRAIYGTQTLPELNTFLSVHYVRALDDGETALLIRRDKYDRCCRPDSLATEGSLVEESPLGDFLRADSVSKQATWTLSSEHTAEAIVIPFRIAPNSASGAFSVGLLGPDGNITGCTDVLNASPPGSLAICVVDKPHGNDWKVIGRSAGNAKDEWIEIGRPLVVLNTNKEVR